MTDSQEIAMKELVFGETILVDGHEYVIVQIRTTISERGRSIELTGADPLAIQQLNDREAERREALQKGVAALEKLE